MVVRPATRPSPLAVPLILALLVAAACSDEASVARAPLPTAERTAPSPAAPSPPAAGAPLVVFLGDSLTAGYGLAEADAFPAVLEREMAARGRPVRVVNAGVSGDTTAGGARRVEWALSQRPDVLVVGLGGNDALRGLPVEETERNLRTIVESANDAGARVLLLGMRIPPNLGPDYVREFEAVYPRVARDTGAELVPFFLEGVGGVAGLNQDDGIHPTTEGQRRIAATVRPHLERLLP
jgi:acyl-CoA thioesterase-1